MILIALIAMAVADQAAELRIIDETQRAMVARADVAGLEGITHPRLRINAPGGRVLDRETFFRNMRSGAIGAEAFTRTPETVSVTADIGIVMGRESFTPTAASELGRTYGSRPLQRRYTNIYVRKGGRWTWLARHANVVNVPR